VRPFERLRAGVRTVTAFECVREPCSRETTTISRLPTSVPLSADTEASALHVRSSRGVELEFDDLRD
jgi:hypothetical protein